MPYLLTDRPNYTLLQALTQVAHAFCHQFLYFNGMLAGRTVTIGRDLRDEPPPPLVEKMSLWLNKKRSLDWNDLQELGKLTDKQWHLLWNQRVQENLHVDVPDMHKQPFFYESPNWNRWALLLLASLTPQQRQQAETSLGLSTKALTQKQRTLFEMVANTGVDTHALSSNKNTLPKLYLTEEKWPNGTLRSIQLHTTESEPYPHETFVKLQLNSTEQGGYSRPIT